MEFRHVDAFTDAPFTGNGLIVLSGSPPQVPGAQARREGLNAIGVMPFCPGGVLRTGP